MIVSHEDTKTRRDKEELSRIVVDTAYRMQVEIGPGLLESVYEAVLEKLLREKGLKEGCRRIVNGKQDFASSCLRVNQNPEAIR